MMDPSGLDPRWRERVAGAPVGRLASLDLRGRPHLVPFCFALVGGTIVSAVDWKPKRTVDLRRLQNIRARPEVQVLVDSYEEDWSRLWWARASGLAGLLEGDAGIAAVDALAAKYPQYRARRPEGPVLCITPTRWSTWSAS